LQFTWVFTRDVQTLADGDVEGARLTAHISHLSPPCVGMIAIQSAIEMRGSAGGTSPLPADLYVRVPVDRDHRFRRKMITQSGGM
jgi:hypothetical protein